MNTMNCQARMRFVQIEGIPKDRVLMALYNGSKHPKQEFFLNQSAKKGMSEAVAQAHIELRRSHGKRLDFDYIDGRVIKADITGDHFDSRCYDMENGHGAAQRAVSGIWTSDLKQC